MHRKEFLKAARAIPAETVEKVWNEEKSIDPGGSLMGYFGGVNFDKNGKIIR